VEDGGGTLRYTHGGMYGRVCGEDQQERNLLIVARELCMRMGMRGEGLLDAVEMHSGL